MGLVTALGAINWTEVTALATVALVIATVLLVGAAVLAAFYAKRDIAAHLTTSKDEIKETNASVQRQIEASYRPLLIDVTRTTSKDSDLDPDNRPTLEFPRSPEVTIDWREVYVDYLPDHVRLAVPLRNVGVGVAVMLPDEVLVVTRGPVGRKPTGPESTANAFRLTRPRASSPKRRSRTRANPGRQTFNSWSRTPISTEGRRYLPMYGCDTARQTAGGSAPLSRWNQSWWRSREASVHARTGASADGEGLVLET